MNLLFAFASIFLLYPILYVLPLRINPKQKLFLLFISLMISLVGILSKNVMPLWQTILITIGLVGSSSILITKRIKETIPSVPSHQRQGMFDSNEYDEDLVEPPIYVGLEDIKDVVPIPSVEMVEPVVSEDITETEEFEFIFEDLINHLDEEEDIHKYVAVTLEIDEGMEDQQVLEKMTYRDDVNDLDQNDTLNAQDVNDLDKHDTLNAQNEFIQINDLEILKELDTIDNLKDLESFEKLDTLDAYEKMDHLENRNSSLYLSEIEKLLIEEETDLEESSNKPSTSQPKVLKEIKLEKLF